MELPDYLPVARYVPAGLPVRRWRHLWDDFFLEQAHASIEPGWILDINQESAHHDPRNFRKAVELDQKYALAYFNRGSVRRVMGALDEAIADFEKSIALNAKHPNSCNNRGLAWHDKGEFDKAVADFSQALDLNPKHAFAHNVKEECLSKVVLFGEYSLRRALREYVEHCHAERNHQGKGNILLFPRGTHICRDGPVRCRERLGGLLRYYHQEAA